MVRATAVWFTKGSFLSLGVALLASCAATPPAGMQTYRLIDPPGQTQPRSTPAPAPTPVSASWYGEGRSIAQLEQAERECSQLAEREAPGQVAPQRQARIMQQCMSERGFRSVNLPECSDRIRQAAMAAGPSGRTVMPPLAPDACVMILPSGEEPIIPNPAEYA